MVQKADHNEATHAQDMMAETTASLTLDGCVCSQCYKPLKAPVVTDAGTNRYGIRLRSYNGFCFHCRRGCIVVQFHQDDKWLIHSFMPLRYESGKFAGIGPDCIIVNPLPEPPPVLTGPGGDYVKVPDPACDPALAAVQGAASGLMQLTHAISKLLKAIETLLKKDRS